MELHDGRMEVVEMALAPTSTYHISTGCSRTQRRRKAWMLDKNAKCARSVGERCVCGERERERERGEFSGLLSS